ncbi:DUF3958 family protein [Enterococcus ureasiticus]|uniref:DUF3958 family protein n=1 Tax=Enterococcus ureasiticus TaxID=903984 RepID=UPI001A8E4412|nr:DUF3958 family protein [Enterococcus ureasiticus]MBO0472429.1 DUF3958 family protein [Enterococcus ureasiticus]
MTEASYQATLRTIQTEQDLVARELRTISKQQEDLYYINQEEQRLYSEVVATSPPEDRTYFQDRGVDSRHQSNKAQQILEDKETELTRTKKQLLEAEEETYREQRKALMEEEKGTQ